jgi:hypothetical protein
MMPSMLRQFQSSRNAKRELLYLPRLDQARSRKSPKVKVQTVFAKLKEPWGIADTALCAVKDFRLPDRLVRAVTTPTFGFGTNWISLPDS